MSGRTDLGTNSAPVEGGSARGDGSGAVLRRGREHQAPINGQRARTTGKDNRHRLGARHGGADAGSAHGVRARSTVARTAIARATMVEEVASRAGVEQVRPEQPVGDAALGGRFQLVPQRTAAQHRLGPEQPFDDGQRSGDVPVVQAFPDPGQAVGTPVRRVDGLEAGQRRTGKGDQEFFPADLGGVVVERGQHPVDQPDPVPGPRHSTKRGCPARSVARGRRAPGPADRPSGTRARATSGWSCSAPIAPVRISSRSGSTQVAASGRTGGTAAGPGPHPGSATTTRTADVRG